ncbi:MAG TPA: ABC transporter permease [Acidimicrobiales bacterium]|nr:ABC transporter permease [Acidimicrobiales bacterium]
MDFLSSVVEYFSTAANWWGTEGMVHRLVEHVGMSAAALATAMLIALPVGLVLGHTGRGGAVAVNLSNLGRAVPSFAIIVLMASIVGIGAKPAYIALVALAVPPMVTNTFTAIQGVDREVREAAVGMGLTGRQVLARVEVPMGLPLMMAGIRTSAVQVVATATLAALVGWGGLGRYIIDGLATRDFQEVFAGALLVAVLSLLVEVGLSVLQRVIVPNGLRGRLVATADLD